MKNNAFLSGVIGGLLGSAVIVGGFVVYQHDNDDSTNQKANTKVSNIEYNVSSDLTKVIDQVKGGVVSVINQQKIQGQMGFEKTSNSNNLETASEGSGVIYKKEGNTAYVVTNNHVVASSDALQVMLSDGTKIAAKLIGSDEYSDIAVLKIESDKVKTVLSFGNSNAIKVGEPAIAIGSPLGSEYADSVTEGIISAKNRTITTKASSGGTVSINAIQTDAAINPGNSGGPLINMAGQVIGINSVKVSNSGTETSVEGMGFAIPSNDVVNIINQLEKGGKIERPALGITMIDLNYISAEQRKSILKLPDDVTEGVVVNNIQDNSPAKEAGLEKYDVITEVDGDKITSSTDLQSKLYNKKIGDKLKLVVYRDGKPKDLTVSLNMSADNLK